jgi:hypothetical protein
MNNSESIIAFVIIFLIVGVFTAITVSAHKVSIRETLEKKGARNIRISWEPLDFDRSNHMYSVEYEDSEGKKHERSCKIHIWDSSIYWTDES